MTNFGFRDEIAERAQRIRTDAGGRTASPLRLQRGRPDRQGQDLDGDQPRRQRHYDSQTINALTPDGPATRAAPDKRMFGSARLEHPMTKTQLMRVEFRQEINERHNLGVGDSICPIARTAETTENTVRFGLNGLMRRRWRTSSRSSNRATHDGSLSADPAIVVLDNFSTGGAGQNGNRRDKPSRSRTTSTTVGKKHTIRTGVLPQEYGYRSDELRTATAR